MPDEKKQINTLMLLHLFIIVLLGSAIYANSLHVPFTFDDKPNIVNNPAIKNYKLLMDAAQAKAVLTEPNLRLQMVSRIVGYASFALNYRIHGLSVYGYHVINIIIHLSNALLVYCLVNLLLSRKINTASSAVTDTISSNSIALFSALLFVSHPINTQAVTYIVQRFTSLATLFYLLSVVGYIKSRICNKKMTYYIISLTSALLAMKTKEFSFTLPFVLLLIEYMFFSDKTSKKAVNLIPFFLIVLIIPLSLIMTTVVTGNALHASSIEFGSSADISRYDYLITQLTVIVRYLKLLFPSAVQNLDYDYPVFHSFFVPQVFLSSLVLSILFSCGIILWRLSKKGALYSTYTRIMSCGVFWFFITISAESSIIKIKDLVFEHRLYLPSIGLFIAAIAGMAMLKDVLVMKKSALSKLIVPCATCVVFLFAFATFSRNIDWQDEVRIWKDTVTKSPYKPRARNNLALAYFDSGYFDEALKENMESLNLKPDSGIHVNIGNIYLHQNRFEQGIREFEEALALKPESEKAYIGLCKSYYLLKRFPDALKACETAIKLKPDYAEAYNMIGMVFVDEGNIKEALNKFNISIIHKPDFAIAHNNAGNAYYRMKNYEAALNEYQTVSSLDPKYIGIYLSIGKIYYQIGRFEDAMKECQKLLLLRPNLPEALKLLEMTKQAINGKKI